MKENVESKNIQWKWKPKRWWLTLILIFVLYQIIINIIYIADIEISKDMDSYSNNFYILFFVIFVILCTVYDRKWKTVTRILWVIGLWIGHALITVLIALSGFVSQSPIGLTNLKLSFLASIPLIILAMRRSILFVELKMT